MLEKELDHDDGELTATQKVRRGLINQKFARELEQIYGLGPMRYLIELVMSGLVIGAIYGLVAMAFSVIYKATGIVNFAQGEVGMLIAYLSLVVQHDLRAPVASALIAFAVLAVASCWACSSSGW